jgi:UDP-N-acetylmuramate: L-alanyl-gamma-D-glutamyl-meso-diaminopimelate ligase
MGGIALLARELGYEVSGCDTNVYPPMSEQLAAAGIALQEGYDPAQLPDDALIVIGNALSRGNPAVEAVLERGLPYISGPQWLGERVLAGRWVIAASGTHGKTTVSSMLAWILEDAGLSPGFLIGGVPQNFGRSAQLGRGDFFVVEADEYDTAFFDKRAKFLHYRPRTLVINNLEFDHADIYPDLAAIQRQFHHLMRCVPANGRVLIPAGVDAIEAVLDMGCWTPLERLEVESAESADWAAESIRDQGEAWTLRDPRGKHYPLQWPQRGHHNVANALAAVAASAHAGVPVADAVAALRSFSGVKRRLELLGEVAGVRVFDDFAHHPTAIASTLGALRGAGGRRELIAVIEPRSNTMRMGQHADALAASTVAADRVFWYQPPGLDWSLGAVIDASGPPAELCSDLAELVRQVVATAQSGDDIIVMSNGSFGGVHQRLLEALDPTH